jgi:hypothetical protein
MTPLCPLGLVGRRWADGFTPSGNCALLGDPTAIALLAASVPATALSVMQCSPATGRPPGGGRQTVSIDVQEPATEPRGQYPSLPIGGSRRRPVLAALLGRPSWDGVQVSTQHRRVPRARELVGEFLGADPERDVVVFTKNTTEAINKLAPALPVESDAVVLTTMLEHHSNDLPWKSRFRRCM